MTGVEEVTVPMEGWGTGVALTIEMAAESVVP